MQNKTREEIEQIIDSCVRRAVKRVKKVLEKASYRPFHQALLTKDIIKSSVFERSFSTSFGQGPIESISQAIAKDAGWEAIRGKDTGVKIANAKATAIADIITNLRTKKASPNWEKELERLQQAQSNATIKTKVRSDLWIRKEGRECYFSIKTVKPNLDQAEVAKRDMLTLKAAFPNQEVFFALYYNPGGEKRADYNWKLPSQIFNMKTDPCVLIGKDYWDFLGGEGTYEDLLGFFTKVGAETLECLGTI